jgi:hypothetical protein
MVASYMGEYGKSLHRPEHNRPTLENQESHTGLAGKPHQIPHQELWLTAHFLFEKQRLMR